MIALWQNWPNGAYESKFCQNSESGKFINICLLRLALDYFLGIQQAPKNWWLAFINLHKLPDDGMIALWQNGQV